MTYLIFIVLNKLLVYEKNSQDIDPSLFQTRVLDWINTSRVENGVGGLNLDDTLNELAKLRNMEMSQVPLEQVHLISDSDVNQVAKNNNLECLIDGNVMPIHENGMFISHSNFNNLEDMVNFLMDSWIEFDVEKDKIYESSYTRTGIHVSMNSNFLIVVQNFC